MFYKLYVASDLLVEQTHTGYETTALTRGLQSIQSVL